MKSFKRLRKETSGGGPNTIRYTKYEPHTAYGFKGGKVLARRSGSSAGGDEEELEEQYLAEAKRAGTSLENELLGHLSHVKDVPHEDAAHTESALNLLDQFHKLRQGLPSQVTASYKHDGGASVHIVNNNGRIGVSDKHRFARGVIAYTPEEVDKHFGHAPEYAASLKHLLAHGADIVGRGENLQGDLLYTPNDSHRREMGGVTTYTSNRITYRGKTKAPLGIALHTQVVDGVAQPLTGRRVSKNIFVPEYQYKPDPHNYNLESRNATEYHLRKAREILQDHDTSHFTPEHGARFATYINSTARTGTNPSSKGYAKFLQQQSKVEVEKLKSEAGRQRKAQQFQGLIDHVNTNSEGFNRSIQLRHHLQKATDHALNGLQHSDLHTAIDGKPSAGEGLVLAMKDKEGRSRPVSKLVPSDVQRALLNNPRFGR